VAGVQGHGQTPVQRQETPKVYLAWPDMLIRSREVIHPIVVWQNRSLPMVMPATHFADQAPAL
jgi:hypothetical protein